MNDEAAARLLKDLEEPPGYATLVLVADELGPLPETIRSRCQLVPFRRLSRGAVEPGSRRAHRSCRPARSACSRGSRAAGSTARPGCSTTAARARRAALLDAARAAYRDDAFDPAAAAAIVVDSAGTLGAAARDREQELVDGLDLPTREAEQRVRRADFGAERAELLASLDDLGGWYRDLVVVAAGAERTVAHADRLAELTEDAAGSRATAPTVPPRPSGRPGASWRSSTSTRRSLLEALFVRLRRAFSRAVPAAR